MPAWERGVVRGRRFATVVLVGALGAGVVATVVASATAGTGAVRSASSGTPERALRLATPHRGSLSLRLDCRIRPASGSFADPTTGRTDFAKVPRWIPVVNRMLPEAPACIPRELLFPELDGGAATRALRERAGGPDAQPPLPIYAPDGRLVAWMMPAIGPLSPGRAARTGLLAPGLVAHPPAASVYERHPR